ncbi:hypothetical protein ACVR25_003187 [Cronobacter sakazakii]|uniref:hypothetical protein n=1 Tax=Cronobacter sakazakii TaxID=28141 RepID=UPI000A1915EA|nr:hypothetical protein [Cronobacter sakazakii]PRC65789.1 hypothetical protein B8W49_09300 [Cronobacter sakazakii]
MSLELVKKEIVNFLKCDSNQALCIKGKWGTGKTHVWKEAFEHCFSEGGISYDLYSYISLFGMDSIDNIKSSIFENTLTKEDFLSSPGIITLEKHISASLKKSNKLRGSFKFIETLMGKKGVIESLSHLGFMNINKQIICFDDVERAGRNIHPLDLFGISSSLKESRDCKLIFIINDEQMDNDKSKEFYLHLEKICDRILEVEPTPEETFAIALKEGDHIDEIVKDKCLKLNLSNIRIIRKIDFTCRDLIEKIKPSISSMEKKLVETVVLGVCSTHSPSDFPPLNFIRNYHSLDWYVSEDHKKAKDDPQKTEWMKQLAQYGFSSATPLDNEIFDGITRGYFEIGNMKHKAIALEEELRLQSRDDSLSRTWDEMYHGSLAVEDDIFLEKLFETTRENINAVTVNRLNSSVRILRETSQESKADILIKEFINVNKDKSLDFWDIQNHIFESASEIDESIREQMIKIFNNYTVKKPIADVIKNISSKKISTEDYLALSKVKQETLKENILKLSGQELLDFLNEATKLYMHGDQNASSAHASVKAALQEIAKLSPLRARRLNKYGINL